MNLWKHQWRLETSIKGIDFIFYCVHLLYKIKWRKINLCRLGPYIDWIKTKEATINPINEDDNKCFQYAATAALNHEKISKNPGRITNIKPFIYK